MCWFFQLLFFVTVQRLAENFFFLKVKKKKKSKIRDIDDESILGLAFFDWVAVMQTPASRRAHEGLAHKQSFGHGDVAFSLSSFLLDCCCLCCCCIGSLRRRRSTGDPKPITASSCYDEWFLSPTKKTRNNNTIISTRLLFSPICAPVLLSYTQFHWKKNPNLFLFCFVFFCFVSWHGNQTDRISNLNLIDLTVTD